jgi:hypothetical protein
MFTSDSETQFGGNMQDHRTTTRAGLLFALMLLAGSIGLWAQNTTADILGTVADTTGAVVVNAKIQVTSLSTNKVHTTGTDSNGNYLLNSLMPGHYRIEISASGFKTFAIMDQLVAAGDRARIDAQMTAGDVTMTVEVGSATPLLQTDSSTVATTLVEKTVQDLPLNGRNFVQLAQLTAGANEGPAGGLTSGSRPDDRRQSASISVNGQSDVMNNEMIDGADNNERIIGTIGIRPSVDAISEFRVQTNDYTAEAGRTAGGVINIITKSGSNQFHGTVYEYFRNDVLDATNNVVQPEQGQTVKKSELRQNQFGGSVGGPLRKDKTFFFGDYEGLRQVQGVATDNSANTPSYQELTDPVHSDLANYGLTAANLSSIAMNWFNLFPKPDSTSTCEVCSYTTSQNRVQNSNVFDIRLDQILNSKNSFYARYSYNSVKTDTPGIFPIVNDANGTGLTIAPGGDYTAYAGEAIDLAFNFQLNYMHMFSDKLLINLVASYLRIDNQANPLNYGTDADAKFGYDIGTAPQASALTPMRVTGYGSIGDGIYLPIDDVDNTFQYSGTVTWTRTRQDIKMGTSIIRRQALNAQNNYGIGRGKELYGTTPQARMANFLMGNIDFMTRGNEFDAPHYRMWESGFFVQDDIRMSPKLTINAGLRYDIMTPFSEIGNRISNFDPSKDELVIASSSNRTAGVVTRYTNFAPRLGFAYDLSHGLVARGGYGISFFPSNYTSQASLKNQPFVSNYTGNYITLAAGLPSPIVPTLDTNNVPMDNSGIADNLSPSFHISYLQQYNLLLQKQLGVNVLTLGYVGMMGRHLGQVWNDINAITPSQAQAAAAAGISSEVYEPFKPASYSVTNQVYIGPIGLIDTEGFSIYNSLQALLQRRFSNGLAIDMNYTLAHGLDNITGLSNEGADGIGAAYALGLPRFEYGNSDVDLRHRIAANIIYELPWGKHLNGAKALLGKGWQVNTLTAWETGMPFTVINSSTISGTQPDAGNSDRPNQISGVSLKPANQNKNQWINFNAFQQQTANTLGNARRNQIYGPHFTHIDFSALKDTNIFKDWTLQFRAECFNVANHPSLGTPDTTLQDGSVANGGTFGQITLNSQNYAPREIQFALKLLF